MSLLFVNEDAVESSSGTIFFLNLVKPEMTVLLKRVPVRREVGNFRPEWSRMFCQGVEV